MDNKYSRDIINNLKKIYNILNSESKININAIDILKKDIKFTINYLKIYNKIFIPLLGDSSTGKSTIINGIIGQHILPTDQNECTRKGIIIKYSNNTNNEISISKVKFVEKKIP